MNENKNDLKGRIVKKLKNRIIALAKILPVRRMFGLELRYIQAYVGSLLHYIVQSEKSFKGELLIPKELICD